MLFEKLSVLAPLRGAKGLNGYVDKSCALNIVKPYRVFIFINYICNQNFILTLTI